MGIKISAPLKNVMDNLRDFAAEQLKDPQPQIAVEVKDEQFSKLVENYSTTLTSGEERGVSVGDIEAVGNFHRDVHSATRLLAGEEGSKFLESNADEDSFKLSFKLPEVGGHGMEATGAFYRQGEDEGDNSASYSAVTRKWNGSEDDVNIDAHLMDLRVRLKSKK